MFGLFKSAPFSDPILGELVRSRGLWRGTIRLESGLTPLILTGTRAAPDPAALAVARELPTRYAAWRSAIETALFEHYEPYAESLAMGEIEAAEESMPCIALPAAVWAHVCLQYICVAPLGGSLTTELGYATAWDEEHTLGARFQGSTFVELCGSVLRP
ncbi:MAG TPA: hypothetical protein VHQ21_10770 [Rhodanobacteraceae bacterium]|jgi:hypothetical protein|nr:hypothetical protein [Rhodanobacteraceae bacterium]